MSVEAARSAHRTAVARLMVVGAGFWGAAPFYALAMRPHPGDRLPPREKWGSAEYETAQIDNLVAGIGFLMILLAAATAVWCWARAAHRLRQGAAGAAAFAAGTALYTGLLAVAGAGAVFGGLRDPAAVGALAVLLPLSAAALVATALPRMRRTPWPGLGSGAVEGR
ncbi:hypothetical protein ACFYUY_04160 [Kitasatospora sp. NPDC004745]|uniref:hypothetical protein n=1 Tax=Kitasatospora sp. NPDC004745 TaxID=3364019 RepID=UPI0036A1ACAE